MAGAPSNTSRWMEHFPADADKGRPPTVVQEPGLVEKLKTLAPCVVVLLVCVVVLLKAELGAVGMATCLVVLATVVWVVKEMVMKAERLSAEGKGVVITGCDSGFGYWLAKHLDVQGATVFAGCLHGNGDGARRLKADGSERLHVLQMDVTSDEQVTSCLQYVKDELKKTGQSGLWGVVNNAGLCNHGEVYLSTMRQFQLVIEVNQLGMVRVTKRFLPLLMQAKGRVVNVTSLKGRLPLPCSAAYTMSKCAGEGFSDSLRLEMVRFGVKVSIIEPCNYRGSTDGLRADMRGQELEEMWQEMTPEMKRLYGLKYLQSQFDTLMAAGQTANYNLFPVVDAMADALLSVEPKRRYLVAGGTGWHDKYKTIALAAPWMPGWFFDWYILRMSKPFWPPLEGESIG